MPIVSTTDLRATFASCLSALYAREVPAYQQLVDVSAGVNAEVARSRHIADADPLSRITAERHGAVRVGTPRELAQLGLVLSGFGMHPVGFYDLREAGANPVPVVSTAFRPIDPDELARNPFRLFVSILVPDDQRFFDTNLTARIHDFLSRRTLFDPRLLNLAAEAADEDGLPADRADEFVTLAVASLSLTDEPIDRVWYDELGEVSSVAADIAGVASTHINHLTPRVLDIDELHRRMTARGIEMLDRIQGPPATDGPEVLLRQTSFRALDERRWIRESDGTVVEDVLRVRFGEVEARGVALTVAGHERYQQVLAATSEAGLAGEDPDAALRSSWSKHFPGTHLDLATTGLGQYTFEVAPQTAPPTGAGPHGLVELLRDGVLVATPIVYEDFLHTSAAGIFQSNLVGQGRTRAEEDATHRDAAWMSAVLDRRLRDPHEVYDEQSSRSLDAAAATLNLAIVDDRSPAMSGSST